MTATWWELIALCAAVTIGIKAFGPVVLGGRELPEGFNGVVALLAPALLSALVVTQVFADGKHLELGADTAGVAVAGLVALRGGSVLTVVTVAAAVAAGLRAVS